jgi:hypothetical protein
MYLVLLVFGAVLTAAGILLSASGVSIHDRAFDMTIVAPGIVAAVGGLALIGLGLALRVLQRIERALAARPMPRVPREAAEPTLITERPNEPARIPFSATTAQRAQAAALATTAPGKLPERSPATARAEGTTINEEMDLALSPRAPLNVDEAGGPFDKLRAARRQNGSAPARIAPRLDPGALSPSATDRSKGPAFEALWPKGLRPPRGAQSASAQALATPAVATAPTPRTVTPAEPEQTDEPATKAPQVRAPDAAEVSVLKSGVVDGMAYTLYSDGSIEAELPQGTLRFGSITDLRNHIEQSA